MQITPIGVIHSPFKEKFGIPRQPGLANTVHARIELFAEYAQADIVRGLEHCSHIWLLFIFSACVDKGWSPTVRPPRLGGNRRMGVLATRSPFRPNPIGMSAVKLEAINTEGGKVVLTVSGADLLDQTPIIDIKPYIPYSDALPDAQHALAESFTPLNLPVIYADGVNCPQALQTQLEEVLACDPRPAYQQGKAREYGLRLDRYNIRWSIEETVAIHVLAISEVTENEAHPNDAESNNPD